MLKYIDTHAHYDDDSFDFDRDSLLQGLPSAGIIGVVNCASNIASAKKCIEIAEQYDYCWAGVGVHPHHAGELKDGWQNEIISLAKHPKVVAIAEIGLDYHYDFCERDIQIKIFEEHIKLAKELDLPIVIHDREAHGDTMDILRKYQPKGVVHCFSGSVEMMKELVKLGMYVGFGGSITFKNVKHPLDAAAQIPIDHIVLETDAPYLAPIPFRGKRCDSTLIKYSAETIAKARNIDVETLYDATTENALKLFPKMSINK